MAGVSGAGLVEIVGQAVPGGTHKVQMVGGGDILDPAEDTSLVVAGHRRAHLEIQVLAGREGRHDPSQRGEGDRNRGMGAVGHTEDRREGHQEGHLEAGDLGAGRLGEEVLADVDLGEELVVDLGPALEPVLEGETRSIQTV